MNAAYIKVGLGGCDMGAGYLLHGWLDSPTPRNSCFTGRFILAERAKAMGSSAKSSPRTSYWTSRWSLPEIC